MSFVFQLNVYKRNMLNAPRDDTNYTENTEPSITTVILFWKQTHT